MHVGKNALGYGFMNIYRFILLETLIYELGVNTFQRGFVFLNPYPTYLFIMPVLNLKCISELNYWKFSVRVDQVLLFEKFAFILVE